MSIFAGQAFGRLESCDLGTWGSQSVGGGGNDVPFHRLITEVFQHSTQLLLLLPATHSFVLFRQQTFQVGQAKRQPQLTACRCELGSSFSFLIQ